MASLEELNNQFQTLQQIMQQQQEKINALEKKVIDYQQDILVLEREIQQYRADILNTENNIDTKIKNAQQETTVELDLTKTKLNEFISDYQGKIIFFAANEYSDGKNISFAMHSSYGEVITSSAMGEDLENMVEFSFTSKSDCTYRLDVEYAAAESRPVQILFNGNIITENGLSQVTGGWKLENQQVLTQGYLTTLDGVNILRFYRPSCFSHIKSVRLILVPSV